ncbi:SH3 domain protein, partial [Elysia marginata]
MGEIRGALHDILAEHERFRDKIKSLEQENEKLKEEVIATHNNIQQNRIQINNLEQYSRKKNIKLLNVKENPNETVSETERKVIEIASSIDVTLNPVDIDIAHRVGKPTGNKNRPIIVRPMHLKTKSALFQNRRKLKGRPIVLVEDLTYDLTYENARLLNQVRGFSFVERSWSMGGVVYAKSSQGKIVRVNAHDNEHSLRALLCSSPLRHEDRRSYKHYRDGQNRSSTDFKQQR